jgi:hypothetical protein
MNHDLKKPTLHYVLAYLFWVLTVAGAALDLLVWRSSVMIVLGMTPWNRYVEHALNQFGFLLMAIAILAFIVFAEYYYRTGVEQGRLFPRFFRTAFIVMLVLALAHLVRLVGEAILGISAMTTLIIVLAELAVCALLFWLWRRAWPRT